jgi:hypothetical protein
MRRLKALAFKRLKTFTIETTFNDYSLGFVRSTANLLQRSSGLERIVIHSLCSELFSKSVSSSSAAPFVWSNLRHLEIQFIEAAFWEKPENTDLFARFLSAHQQLQTFIMGNSDIRAFSLAPYPNALPNLKRLHAPLPIIAGILESSMACYSLTTILDSDGHRTYELEPVLETILSLLERLPSSPLQRLRIQVPDLRYDLFRRLSKVAPGIRVLEFIDRSSHKFQDGARRAVVGSSSSSVP